MEMIEERIDSPHPVNDMIKSALELPDDEPALALKLARAIHGAVAFPYNVKTDKALNLVDRLTDLLYREHIGLRK